MSYKRNNQTNSPVDVARKCDNVIGPFANTSWSNISASDNASVMVICATIALQQLRLNNRTATITLQELKCNNWTFRKLNFRISSCPLVYTYPLCR